LGNFGIGKLGNWEIAGSTNFEGGTYFEKVGDLLSNCCWLYLAQTDRIFMEDLRNFGIGKLQAVLISKLELIFR